VKTKKLLCPSASVLFYNKMNKFFTFFLNVLTFFFFSNGILAQSDSLSKHSLQEVVVKANWAGSNTPMTYKNLNTNALQNANNGQDMPFLLQQTPSVVASSDAGTGIGYTGIRIRGTDPTRINITLNGIPYNDAESQGVYWVNMYDIFASTEQIQIQRGVGTSTNGAGAFGASINLNTNKLQQEPFGEILTSVGAFNTQRYMLKWGSGLLKNGLSIEGRLSSLNSDGYVDRAASNLDAYDFAATWLFSKASLRFNMISGKEITYQSWYGLPIQFAKSNRRYNAAGTEKADEPYDNQVDNYSQKHFQLFYNQQINSVFNTNIALFYTRGFGYYEEYKAAQGFEQYGLPALVIKKDTVLATDLVRQRWLDNDFYGVVYGLNYDKNKLKMTLGGGWNRYDGQHFGEVIWGRLLPEIAQKGYRWYDNQAKKVDFNTFLKGNFQINAALAAYADVQVRHVQYDFVGKDRNAKDLAQRAAMTFFNPKMGLHYGISEHSKAYVSFAVANREPNRNDFVNSSIDSRPLREQLQNWELGYSMKHKQMELAVNVYHMNYKNQLVLTGKINDVGEYTRINIPKSYRNGIELEVNTLINKYLSWNSNLTLSANKIKVFDEYVDNWTTWTQEKVTHRNSDLAFSPSVIGSNVFTCKPVQKKKHTLQLDFVSKYVGKQYLDNSSDETAALAAYWQHDLRATHTMHESKYGTFHIGLTINNLFNNDVVSNGWLYRYMADFDAPQNDPYSIQGRGKGVYNQIGYYPQAFRNMMFTFRWVF
jgi:iron complex outermembrane recepter protein